MYNNIYYMAGHDAKEKYIERLGLVKKIDFDADPDIPDMFE